jgi:hypothetical protein
MTLEEVLEMIEPCDTITITRDREGRWIVVIMSTVTGLVSVGTGPTFEHAWNSDS